MLPILCASRREKDVETFVRQIIEKENIHSSSVYRVYPEKTVITIDQIRDVSLVSARTKDKKLIVIYAFDTAKEESQNAMLKTLEEDSSHTQFILVVPDATHVLPTIRSRSHSIRLTSENELGLRTLEKYGFSKATSYAQWLSVSARLPKEKHKDIFDELLTLLQSKLHTDSQNKLKYARALTDILRYRNLVLKNNVNYEHALDAVAYTLEKHKLYPLSH